MTGPFEATRPFDQDAFVTLAQTGSVLFADVTYIELLDSGIEVDVGIWQSLDGASWTEVTAPPTENNGTLTGADDVLFFAGATPGSPTFVSTDEAATWSELSLGSSPGFLLQVVETGDGGFVAFTWGVDDQSSVVTTLHVSTDGTSWTELDAGLLVSSEGIPVDRLVAASDSEVILSAQTNRTETSEATVEYVRVPLG